MLSSASKLYITGKMELPCLAYKTSYRLDYPSFFLLRRESAEKSVMRKKTIRAKFLETLADGRLREAGGEEE
jgi:hypothetical protein